MKELDFSLAPKDWAICFQNDCPLKDTCLRYAIGNLAPATLTHHATVLPAAREGDRCSLFATKEPVCIARGMEGLFAGVRAGDIPEMRSRLFRIFGSRAHFYRYRKGDYVITPEQQALVEQLFREYGYTQSIPYDLVTRDFYFPNV